MQQPLAAVAGIVLADQFTRCAGPSSVKESQAHRRAAAAVVRTAIACNRR
jgi:hypothetical protein